jgi:beta-1,4-mannosyl-glycoprotein beta-1,4-N-acetylglucosaminyltransferase
MFLQELDLLELRLRVLDEFVDRFVIVESKVTFQGETKPLLFQENEGRFEPWKRKIRYCVYDPRPAYYPRRDWPWHNEFRQRNTAMQALIDLKPDDWLLVGDLDEMPPPSELKNPRRGSFSQTLCSYWLDYQWSGSNWRGTVMVQVKDMLNSEPQWPSKSGNPPLLDEYRRTLTMIRNFRGLYPKIQGGWHWSYTGGIEGIQGKIKSHAHVEFSNLYWWNYDRIAKCMVNGLDLFERRQGRVFSKVPMESYPIEIRRHLELPQFRGLLTPPHLEQIHERRDC